MLPAREEIEKEHLEEIIPKRKENKRARITNGNIWLTDGNKYQWEMPKRKPNKIEKYRKAEYKAAHIWHGTHDFSILVILNVHKVHFSG